MELCVQYFLTFMLLASRAGAQNFQFAFDLYNAVTDAKPQQNVVVSPLSVETALGLLLMGASGNTEAEILSGLRYGTRDLKQIQSYFRNLHHNPQLGSSLILANKVYSKAGYDINPNFYQTAREVFNSETESINFADSVTAADNINFWVNRQTGGKITNLFRADQLSAATRLAVVNALYFKGLWKTPFNVRATQKRPFWVGENRPVMIDIMYGHMDIEYADIPELNAQVARIPYEGSGLGMMIILPNEKTGLPDLENRLRNFDLRNVTSRLRPRTVDVSLPKFNLESTVDLKNVLRKLGVVELFSENALLPNVIVTRERLTVDSAVHKASIDVDEKGTVAAAATGFGVIALSASPTFTVDRPFLFAIVGNGVIPIIGSIRTV